MYVWSPLPRSLSATFRDIANPKSRIRVSAIADLVRWADTEARERCLQQLVTTLRGDEDLEVRAAAALALADTGAVESLDALIEAAERGQPRLRQMALVAIGELATPDRAGALAPVRAGLQSEAPALRFQALVAASHLFDKLELLACLLAAMADEESRIRYVACRIAEERFFAADKAGEPMPSVLEEKLISLLSDGASEVALAAAILLGPRGSEPARELVVSALNRRGGFSQPEDEQAAIEMCADLRLDAARPGLAARAFGGVLGGKSPLAFQARVALARLGDERAREHIIRGLSSWSRAVRREAVAAAGQARLQAARARLMEMRDDGRELDDGSVAEALQALDR
jgi:HEAT repeat protein